MQRAIIFVFFAICGLFCLPAPLPAAPLAEPPAAAMSGEEPVPQPVPQPMPQPIAGHSVVWTSLPDNAKFLMAAAYFRGHDIACLEIAAKDKNVKAEDYVWIKDPQADMKFVVLTVNLVNRAYLQPENRDLLLPSVLDVAAISAVYNVPEEKFMEKVNALRAESAPAQSLSPASPPASQMTPTVAPPSGINRPSGGMQPKPLNSRPLNSRPAPRPAPTGTGGPGSSLKKGPASDIYDQQARNLENSIERAP